MYERIVNLIYMFWKHKKDGYGISEGLTLDLFKNKGFHLWSKNGKHIQSKQYKISSSTYKKIWQNESSRCHPWFTKKM